MKLPILFLCMLLTPALSNAMLHHRLHKKMDESKNALQKLTTENILNHKNNAYFLLDEADLAEGIDCTCCFMTSAALCSNSASLVGTTLFSIATIIFASDLLITSSKKLQLRNAYEKADDALHHHQD